MNAVAIAQLKVLLVDDHIIMRKQLERMLMNLGVTHVDQAATANEAAEKMDSGNYDLILMDWHMPGKSGYNLMQSCRGERKYDDVAFVMVTAEAEARLMGEAMKAGATAYIIKPPTEEVVGATVVKVLDWLAKRRDKAGDAALSSGPQGN